MQFKTTHEHSFKKWNDIIIPYNMAKYLSVLYIYIYVRCFNRASKMFYIEIIKKPI